MKKLSRALITMSILILAFFITANALDVNDISVFCNDGEILKVTNSQWLCANDNTGSAGTAPGSCLPNQAVQNTTAGGVECIDLPAGSSGGAGKAGNHPYLYNDSTVMYFNETLYRQDLVNLTDYAEWLAIGAEVDAKNYALLMNITQNDYWLTNNETVTKAINNAGSSTAGETVFRFKDDNGKTVFEMRIT